MSDYTEIYKLIDAQTEFDVTNEDEAHESLCEESQFKSVHKEVDTNGRWYNTIKTVHPVGDIFIEMRYTEAATEMQEQELNCSFKIVKPVKKTVTVYE